MALSSTKWNELRVALALLTRLPLPLSPQVFAAHKSNVFWAYPVVGGIVALLAATTGLLALGLNLPPWAVAALILTTQITVTGALHEDGLADSVDGLWGGWDRARRLDIMKDSHIGSYGVLALILSVLIRVACLAALADHGTATLILALLAAGPLSRAACVMVMFALPNARQNGLSASAGRPNTTALTASLAIGALSCLIFGTLAALLIAAASVFTTIQIARTKIQGQTGDILGATQQLTEITILLCLAATL